MGIVCATCDPHVIGYCQAYRGIYFYVKESQPNAFAFVGSNIIYLQMTPAHSERFAENLLDDNPLPTHAATPWIRVNVTHLAAPIWRK